MKSIIQYSTLVFVLAFFMTACGGGGGGSGGPGGGGGNGGITYAGVTTQAPLTAGNANQIFSLVWGGSALSDSNYVSSPLAKSVSSGDAKGSGIVHLARHLARVVPGTIAGLPGGAKNVNRTAQVNETRTGTVSGNVTIAGSVDDGTGTGSLTMTFANFNDGDGNTHDGAVTLRVDGYDMALGIMTDWTMNCSAWTIKSAASDVSLSGSMRVLESAQNGGEILTINMDGRDNLRNETFRFENFVLKTGYDSQTSPISATETYGGRVYAGKFGYVEVSTVSPCVYSDPKANPSSGGPIILAGAGKSRAAISPVSSSYVKIEVDDNGDAAFEATNRYSWGNLSGAAFISINVAPAAPSAASGTTQQFTATGTFSDNSTQDMTSLVKWASSDETIAQISSRDGSYSMCWEPGCAYGWRVGSATITATLADLSGSATLAVTPAVLVSIAVHPVGPAVTPVIAMGATQQFEAIGIFSDQTSRDVTPSVTWSSSDPAVATISNTSGSNGMASSIASGTTTITATSGALSGSATLSVSAWTMQNSGTASDLYRVVWAGTQFVAAGANGIILTSSDGKKFEQRTSGASSALYDVAWSGSLLVAVGDSSQISSRYYSIFTSSDGITWTPQSTGAVNRLYGIVWSGNKFVAVGAYGTILTSPDGAAWTPQTSGSPNNLYGVVWSGNKFVAVGAYGTILTSPDGAAWTPQNSGTLNYLGRVAWSGSQFVAISGAPDNYGYSSEFPIHTSPDGIAWTDRKIGPGMIWEASDVAWCGTRFVVVGAEGTVLTSGDGAIWTPWIAGTRNFLSAVGCSGTHYVVTGRGGMILSSP